jgi:gluconolactonase
MKPIAIALILLFAGVAMADDLIPPDAKVEKLAGDLHFIEGPVWIDGYLIFSDIPASKLMKWDGKQLSVFRDGTNNSNGNTRDREGRLISCEHTSRRVTRTEKDGSITVLADNFEGKKFNSPNDVVVKSDGTIWFTDPTYGLPKGQAQELSANFLFCHDPQTNVTKAFPLNFDQPNGLCFSRDEKLLYVADSGKPHHIRVFEVVLAPRATVDVIKSDGTPVGVHPKPGVWELHNGKVFAVIDKGVPDGIRCDEKGNIWSSAGDGVQIFSPDGKLIQRIAVPESPANLCFGGEDGKTLFMTARTSLYSIKTNIRGAGQPRPGS